MFCPDCGEEIDDESKFCKHCGKSINIINTDNTKANSVEIIEDSENEVNNIDTTQKKQPRSFNKKSSKTKEDTQTSKSKNKTILKVIGGCCIGLIILVVIVGMISPERHTTVNDKTNKTDNPDNLTEEEFKANCTELNYNAYMKKPEQFERNHIKVSGRVLQIMEFTDSGTILLYQDNKRSQIIYIMYDGTNDILKDDYITVYGTAYDTTTYTSQTNKKTECPNIFANYIDKKG